MILVFKTIPCSIILVFLAQLSLAQVGPAVPVKDAIPTTTVKDPTGLNLPYQPKDPNGVSDPNTQGLPTLQLPNPDEPKIDWAKVPFVPFKTPDLPPAPDPVI